MKDWLARLRGGPATPLRALRWIVVDCETTGLDPARDELLSVGAVGLRAGRIDPADSFHAVLRDASTAPPGNVLIHGIGADARRAGREPAEALRGFAAYAGDAVPVAFHAAFDAAVLGRAMAAAGVPSLPAPWLDLAQLAPALEPARRERGLDEWLQALAIPVAARHDALQDAFATAQLLLVLLARAERQGAGDLRALRSLARNRRWAG